MRSRSRAWRTRFPRVPPAITNSKLPTAIEIRSCHSVSSSSHLLIQSAWSRNAESTSPQLIDVEPARGEGKAGLDRFAFSEPSSIRWRFLASSTTISALLYSWIFFSGIDLAVGRNRDLESIVVDQNDVGVAVQIAGSRSVREKCGRALRSGRNGARRLLAWITASYSLVPLTLCLKVASIIFDALNVANLDQERPFGMVELAVLREQLVEHVLDVLEEDHLGVVGASGIQPPLT